MRDVDDINRRIAERTSLVSKHKLTEDEQKQQARNLAQQRAIQEFNEANEACQSIIDRISTQMDDPEIEYLLHQIWDLAAAKSITRYQRKRDLWRGDHDVPIEVPTSFEISRSYPILTGPFFDTSEQFLYRYNLTQQYRHGKYIIGSGAIMMRVPPYGQLNFQFIQPDIIEEFSGEGGVQSRPQPGDVSYEFGQPNHVTTYSGYVRARRFTLVELKERMIDVIAVLINYGEHVDKQPVGSLFASDEIIKQWLGNA